MKLHVVKTKGFQSNHYLQVLAENDNLMQNVCVLTNYFIRKVSPSIYSV